MPTPKPNRSSPPPFDHGEISKNPLTVAGERASGSNLSLSLAIEDVAQSSERGDEFKSQMSNTPFDKDLLEWVDQVSESFHVKAFITELLGQNLHDLCGPLSAPILWCLYGSVAALKNRRFLPKPSSFSFFKSEFRAWMVRVAIAIYVWHKPKDVSLAEIKFIGFCFVLRNFVISIKYAYMTTENWKLMNTKMLDDSWLASHMLIPAWSHLTVGTALFYAEASFIGVLGSTQQRSGLFLRFVPWTSEHTRLSDMQGRLDVTVQRLIFQPVEIEKSTSRFRKPKKRLPVVTDEDTHLCLPSVSTYAASTPNSGSVSPYAAETPKSGHQRRSMEEINNVRHQLPPQKACATMAAPVSDKHTELTLTSGGGVSEEDADKAVIEAASSGIPISIEDMFFYFVRGVRRSEKAHLPNWQQFAMVNIMIVLSVFAPSISRFVGGGAFLGDSWQTTVFTVLFILGMYTPLLSLYAFIVAGAKDFWRRRALLRSCAALLTLQHYYRRGCPVEVDLLPILDLSDPHTIEAWRKLRQLCLDWGKVFLLRIQSFAAIFICGTIFMGADLVASLELPPYMRANDIDLITLSITFTLLSSVFACLLLLVFLGHDINHAAERHSFLIKRQRLVLASRRHRIAAAPGTGQCKKDDIHDEVMDRACDLLDILGEDLLAEREAMPLRLLGATCDLTLLATMNVIPVVIISSVFKFCLADETFRRCQNSVGNL